MSAESDAAYLRVTAVLDRMKADFEIYKDKFSELEDIANAYETTCDKLKEENEALHTTITAVRAYSTCFDEIEGMSKIRDLLS